MYRCQHCGTVRKPNKPQHAVVTERHPQDAPLHLRGQIKKEVLVCSRCAGLEDDYDADEKQAQDVQPLQEAPAHPAHPLYLVRPVHPVRPQ